MENPNPRYYVRAIERKGDVVGYGVYDCIGGMVSEHERFDITADQPWKVALHLANAWRDDANSNIK